MFVDINVSYLESSADARWQTTNQRVYRGEPVYERARCKLSLFICNQHFSFCSLLPDLWLISTSRWSWTLSELELEPQIPLRSSEVHRYIILTNFHLFKTKMHLPCMSNYFIVNDRINKVNKIRYYLLKIKSRPPTTLQRSACVLASGHIVIDNSWGQLSSHAASLWN